MPAPIPAPVLLLGVAALLLMKKPPTTNGENASDDEILGGYGPLWEQIPFSELIESTSNRYTVTEDSGPFPSSVLVTDVEPQVAFSLQSELPPAQRGQYVTLKHDQYTNELYVTFRKASPPKPIRVVFERRDGPSQELLFVDK
jgi:hypothetical protein